MDFDLIVVLVVLLLRVAGSFQIVKVTSLELLQWSALCLRTNGSR